LEGFQSYKGNKISHAQGVKLVNKVPDGFHEEVQINTTDKTGIEEAIALAKEVDVVVMVLGEYGFQSGEGRSRAFLNLPGFQQELLEKVAEVNPNIVLVVMNGRPLILNWASENIPAIVEAWHLGSQSGHAIAQVLYGDYNPSGKLPMSFPRSVGQLPIYYNHKSTGRPGADGEDMGSVFWSHYGDEKNSPLYPFGYGLSYTQFEYSPLQLSDDIMDKGGSLKASIKLKNTGKFKGKEVVQFYIQDPYASATRPVKELKGFQMVELNPGETKEVSFRITEEQLKFYNARQKWEAESGTFYVFIGSNSAVKEKKAFELR
jgi:beta-glucosidase